MELAIIAVLVVTNIITIILLVKAKQKISEEDIIRRNELLSEHKPDDAMCTCFICCQG